MITSHSTAAILTGTQRELITDPTRALLGPDERESLIATFDAMAARGGKEADEVPAFERALAQKFGAADAVATVSATSALHLAFVALGIGPGDEVLVAPYSFAATAHAILHAGARPVFVDIARETLCIAPNAVRRNIGPRTKAILVVQIGGKPAEMTTLAEIARSHGLALVEDAAQGHGARYRGRYVGALGDVGVLSFSPKLMTAGRGGALLLHNLDLAERCRELRFHGLPGHRDRVRSQVQLSVESTRHFVHRVPGYSLALTALQAAVLMPQIGKLDDLFERRHANGCAFAERLAGIPGLTPVLGRPEGRSNFYMLEVLYDPAAFAGLSRDAFVAALSWEGVPVSPVSATQMLQYENPSLAAFRSDCHVAEEVMRRLLVFGHPLQSLIFNGARHYVEAAADAVERVAAQAAAIAAHLRETQSALSSGPVALDRCPTRPASVRA